MHKRTYGNLLRLLVHFHGNQTHFRTKTRFETEAQGNKKMTCPFCGKIDLIFVHWPPAGCCLLYYRRLKLFWTRFCPTDGSGRKLRKMAITSIGQQPLPTKKCTLQRMEMRLLNNVKLMQFLRAISQTICSPPRSVISLSSLQRWGGRFNDAMLK